MLFLSRRKVALVGVFTLISAGALSAQATTYVPNLDPAYRDLDALVVAGLVRGEIHGDRPYSRLTFARYAVEARRVLKEETGEPRARFGESLRRLEREFAAEIAALCPEGRAACEALPRTPEWRSVRTDMTIGDSPSRRAPIAYAQNKIDANVNPLLQGNQGRELADGWTLAGEGSVDIALGRHFAAELYPRVWVARARTGGTGGGATLQDGYVRALFGNLAIDLGRNQVEHGQAREGGSLLSYNPRGLDLARISLDRPARLPWVFRALGPFQGSALVADLGRGSDNPHSKLIVFNASIRPHPSFEIGATLLNHQGGRNAPGATFLQRLDDIFMIHPGRDEISDKAVSVDARLTLPRLKAEVYAEAMTTFIQDFRLTGAARSLRIDGLWVVGARRVGLGPRGRFDVWAEGRKSGVYPYTHGQLTSGLTLDGRILGDPIGPLAGGASAGVDWTGPGSRLSVTGAWERYYGDAYVTRSGTNTVRTADGPDETRTRLTVDWTTDPGPSRLFTRLRLGIEHVDQFRSTPGHARNNGMVQAQVGWRW